MGINRVNKKKQKTGCGCKMCKPHKGGYAPKFKSKEHYLMKSLDNEIKMAS